MDRKELALQLHHSNFNCAQCVACSYCNVYGFDPVTVFKLSEAFGGGMGDFDICGAVSGMAMVIGMMNSDGNLDDPQTKHQTYNLITDAKKRFKDKNKSCTCSELRGLETGVVLRPCDDCITDAIEILDDILLGIKVE